MTGTGPNAASADIHVDPKSGIKPDVQKNPDGSLDIVIPKGPGHPQDIRVHVEPGKHVRVDLGKNPDGTVKIKVQKAQPHGEAPGNPGGGPNKPPGKDDLKPDVPKPPGGGPGGGPPGGGGKPPGGGGGMPSGGGGGMPSGGGGPGGGPPMAPPQGPPGGTGGGERRADSTTMRKLGDDIDIQGGAKMDAAKRRMDGTEVSWPAFGVLGFPLNMAHGQVKNSASQYLADGRSTLTDWKRALHRNAGNWKDAEDNSTL